MAQAATVFQKQDLKEMIISLYEFSGIPVPPEVKNNPVNDSVAEIFRQILAETGKCSSRFKLIPAPPKGPASIAWIVSHIGKLAFDKCCKKKK
ncbi:MAG: hypothetical protein M3Z21_14470 [Pseudomonadota bacterium]|nr:hypothetical protein [Pseudomonadota bacterium]